VNGRDSSMPTKRTPFRRIASRTDLFDELREVLLDGWDSPWQPLDSSEAFRIFTLSDADPKAAWIRHRHELMTDWKRPGRTGQPWAVR